MQIARAVARRFAPRVFSAGLQLASVRAHTHDHELQQRIDQVIFELDGIAKDLQLAIVEELGSKSMSEATKGGEATFLSTTQSIHSLGLSPTRKTRVNLTYSSAVTTRPG